jgi:dipeptide transport system permease protein
MFTLLLKKLVLLVPTLLGVTLVAFALIRLIPGDPIEIMVGERRLDADARAALMQRLGLDQPLYVQYGRYVGDLLHGDLGKSLVTREPVSAEFAVLFPATIELASAALFIALVIGLSLGLAAALKRGSGSTSW